MHTDQRLLLARFIMEPLLRHNPYLNLYYSLHMGGPVSTGPLEYRNYLHQVSAYTEAMLHSRIRLLIGDEVGLGKTVEAIRILKSLLERNNRLYALIIVPAGLVGQWVDEDLKHLGLKARRISEYNIDEYYRMLRETGMIEPGIYIGSMDKLKYSSRDRAARGGRHKPYYDLVSSVHWDIVVIDEAHRLTSPLTGRPTLRYRRLGKLCVEAEHCLLLSATPSRGEPVDFIRRLKLLDEALGELEARIRKKKFMDRDIMGIYRALHGPILIRRTKEYVNKAENKKIFPPLESRVGIVDLDRSETIVYNRLIPILTRLMRILGTGREAGLLKTILLKRALSSPTGFLRTLNRIIGHYGGGGRIGIDELMDRLDEVEPDIVLGEILSKSSMLRRIKGLGKLVDEYARAAAGLTIDSKAKALQELIASLPEILRVKGFLVFTEYRDTLEYLYDLIMKGSEEAGLGRRGLLRTIYIEALENYCKGQAKKERICRAKKEQAVGELQGYSEIRLINGREYYIVKISSENKHVIPIVKKAVNRLGSKGITPVVLATDVASEGLNLQALNIVVNYDVPWTPLRREQRLGRIYRLRQENKCYIVDLVRNHWLELDIYTRLLLRLYGMSEQLLTGRTIGGLIHFMRAKRAEDYRLIHRFYAFNEIDETQILGEVADAIASIEEEGEEGFRERIVTAVEKIIVLINQYNTFIRVLEQPVIPPGSLARLSRDLYGFSSHDEAYSILSELYTHILKDVKGREIRRVPRRMDNIVIELDDKELPKIRSLRYRGIFFYYSEKAEWSRAIIYNVGLVDENTHQTIYRFPVAVLIGEEHDKKKLYRIMRVLVGGEVVEWLNTLLDQTSGGYLLPAATNAWLFQGGMLTHSMQELLKNEAKARIRQRIIPWINRVKNKISQYRNMVVGESRITPIEPHITVYLDEYAVIIHGLIEEEEPALSEAEKCFIEKQSLEILIPFLQSKNYTIGEQHACEKNPYDLTAIDPRGRKYYIEAKAHLPPVMNAVLTPNEADFAEKHGDKYIVCLITDMASGNPLIICRPYPEIKKKILPPPKQQGRVVLFF